MSGLKTISKFLLALLALLMVNLHAEEIVLFPFQVETENPRSVYGWLGVAGSFYLTNALLLNNVSVLDSENVLRFLQENKIYFPFEFSKALAIELGRVIGAKKILWAEIVLKKDARIFLKSALIDLDTLEQKILPAFEGKQEKILSLFRELFLSLSREVSFLKNKKIEIPDFKLTLTEFETLIKGMLYKDLQKRIEILQTIKSDSPLLSWQLGLLFFEQQKFSDSLAVLARLYDDSLFQNRAFFLSGLAEYKLKNYRQALNYFIRLQQRDFRAVESNNNAGVIYYLMGQSNIARQCYLYSLSLALTPEVIYNYFQLESEKDFDHCWKWLIMGLKNFPADNSLQKIFFSQLEKNAFSDEIGTVLQSYIDLNRELPQEKVLLQNPYLDAFRSSVSQPEGLNELEVLFNAQNWEAILEKAETIAFQNPFYAEIYYYQAMAYFNLKNFAEAEKYALCALFLERENRNLALLQQIYQTVNQPEKYEFARKEFFSVPDTN